MGRNSHEEEPEEVADYYTFDDAGRLVEIVEHMARGQTILSTPRA
ncbi:MAG: hypothetical protein K0R84_330 [Clostridia bacterium]|jgi:hypothetical protein|nr:hypothetical protein [Clostridia bacterium]